MNVRMKEIEEDTEVALQDEKLESPPVFENATPLMKRVLAKTSYSFMKWATKEKRTLLRGIIPDILRGWASRERIVAAHVSAISGICNVSFSITLELDPKPGRGNSYSTNLLGPNPMRHTVTRVRYKEDGSSFISFGMRCPSEKFMEWARRRLNYQRTLKFK